MSRLVVHAWHCQSNSRHLGCGMVGFLGSGKRKPEPGSTRNVKGDKCAVSVCVCVCVCVFASGSQQDDRQECR